MAEPQTPTHVIRQLLFLMLGLYLAAPVASDALAQQKTPLARQNVKPPASSPSPTPEPAPPALDFQVVPDRDSVGPDDEIRVSVFVANKSSKPITRLKLNFSDRNFKLDDVKLPEPLPPFGSLRQTASMKSIETPYSGAHKLLFSLEYAWNANGTEFVSAQPATLTVSIVRRFEEEAKGFPGGTAAFLYLLLPIIPAILSYQLFEGRRKGEDWKLPSFRAEYVVPAFLVAVLVNLGILILFQYNASLGYSDPLVFIAVLFMSAVAGAVLPLYRWRKDLEFRKLWDFTKNETFETYLRKALLKPGAPTKFELAKGTVDEDEWEGLVLKQPNGSTVLGAALQVSYPHQATDKEWNDLTQKLVNEAGVVLNAEELVSLIEAKKLVVGFDTRIRRAGRGLDKVVIIDEVKNWKRASGQAGPLIVPSR
ncbi:MAG TPA: hypothetical protein VJP89_13925 [Pyrinomonadaceae bacterium]|nr:hypothetical protein [Pyrinomonadaceae bacterium]